MLLNCMLHNSSLKYKTTISPIVKCKKLTFGSRSVGSQMTIKILWQSMDIEVWGLVKNV